MGTSHNPMPHGDDKVVLGRLPPEGGFKLYQHKNAEKMRTKNWHGYYWARRSGEGDYEIRSVPSSLGEHSLPGGVMPKQGFEENYEKADP
jgi:hypothetical protein